MIRIDTDNAVIRIHKQQIRACSCCDSWTEVYNQLVQDAAALKLALDSLQPSYSTVRWTVEITD